MLKRMQARAVLEELGVEGQVPGAAEIVTMVAVAAVTKNHLVALVDGGTEAGIQHPASSGARVCGVALASGAIGDEVPVLMAGLCRVKMAGTVASPSALSGATSGKAQAATTGHSVAGYLLEDGVLDELKLAFIVGLGGIVA